MSKIIRFVLDGCDISFVAEAPEDITLAQLLKQCDKIHPDWCACGIKTATEEEYGNCKTEIFIGYDSIRKDDGAACTIAEPDLKRKKITEHGPDGDWG